jgi:hypothetical protein
MISVVVPVGEFPFFINACVKNIHQTCELPEQLDLVLLMSRNNKPLVEQAVEKIARDYPFRVLRAPFDAGFNHLRLLDWAFYEGLSAEWVVIQHSDLFWTTKGWLSKTKNKIDQNLDMLVATCPDLERWCCLQGSTLPQISDMFCICSREKFVQHDLHFNWGVWPRQITLSKPTTDAIRSGALKWTNGKVLAEGVSFLDGSMSITMEAGIRFPDLTRLIDISDCFRHIGQFYRVAETLRVEGKTIYCRRHQRQDFFLPHLATYSYLTSCLFDVGEIRDRPFPWSLFRKIHPNYEATTVERLAAELAQYKTSENNLGDGDFGIENVIFLVQHVGNAVKLL